jgi:hypothetical protein
MTTPKIGRTIATLNLPKAVPALITVAKAIVQKVDGNPDIPNPDPPLPEITAATGDLEVAEAAALARTRGAATTRNDKRAALVTLLEQLKGGPPGGLRMAVQRRRRQDLAVGAGHAASQDRHLGPRARLDGDVPLPPGDQVGRGGLEPARQSDREMSARC